MGDCPFYEIVRQTFRSQEVGSVGVTVPDLTYDIPYCGFNPSPVTRQMALALGRSNMLKCDGECSKCQLDKSVFDWTPLEEIGKAG